MEILKVENLCKTYGKGEAKVNALKNVSFSLEKGEFAAVVGESGSGKSTLLNCIGALDTPTSGSIFIDASCENLIKEFASYIWDAKAAERGEDKPVKEHDHALDAIRYMCYTIIRGVGGMKILK